MTTTEDKILELVRSLPDLQSFNYRLDVGEVGVSPLYAQYLTPVGMQYIADKLRILCNLVNTLHEEDKQNG